MPEDDEFDSEDGEETPAIVQQRKRIKDLEKQLKETSEKAALADVAQRKLMFLEAGIQPNDRNRYFMDAYQGEMSVESIKAEAVKAGFLQDTSAVSPEEAAAHEALAGASAGADPSNPDLIQKINEVPDGDVDGLMALLQKSGVPTSHDRP